jgi:hypothetical protein
VERGGLFRVVEIVKNAAFCKAHLSDDEAVAKMGHPAVAVWPVYLEAAGRWLEVEGFDECGKCEREREDAAR